MVNTILVPLDGSPLAERALPYAERIAETTSARLELIRVIPLTIIEPPDEDLGLADEARTYLRRITDQLIGRGRDVDSVTLWGDPAACILDQIQSTQADLVVMGTHGRSGPGRWLYGSVADSVLRASRVPVIVVPPAVTTAWPAEHLNRVLVPLDGSELAEVALAPAGELARTLGSDIVLLEVVPFPPYALYDNSAALAAFEPDVELAKAEEYLAEVAAHLTTNGFKVHTVAELANPAVAVAEVARREHADLVVMATHGRSGFERLVLGSVATGTLQRTSVPLMLIGPAALRGRDARVTPLVVPA